MFDKAQRLDLAEAESDLAELVRFAPDYKSRTAVEKFIAKLEKARGLRMLNPIFVFQFALIAYQVVKLFLEWFRQKKESE